MESIEALERRMTKSGLDDASEGRIARAMTRYPARIPDIETARQVVGCPAHRRVAEEISDRAARLGIAWAPSAAVATSPVSTT
jgi:hypothetical protein